MKLQLLLILAMLTLVIIPVYSQELSFEIYLQNGASIPGMGSIINIAIIGASQSVDIDFILDDEIVTSLSSFPSSNGQINLPWIIPKDTPFGVYTVNATDSINFAEVTYNYVNSLERTIIDITTDKPEYDEGETIYITGSVSEILKDHIVSLMISSANDDIIMITQLEIDENKTFNYNLSDIIELGGTYTISISYEGSGKEITFEYLGRSPTAINVQTDKSEYYINEDILINGEINYIDLDQDTTIIYEIRDSNSDIMASYTDSLQRDGSFNFIIPWEQRELWDYSGDVLLVITIQNNNKEYRFYSSILPNKTNEILYNMAMDQDIRITNNTDTIRDIKDKDKIHMDGMMSDYDNITLQLNEIYEPVKKLIGITPIIPDPIIGGIDLATDNTTYYQNDVINLSGSVNTSSQEKTTTYEVYYDTTLLTQGSDELNQTFEFEFDISTNWGFEGEYYIIVTTGDYSSTIFFYYYNTPEKTPESNWGEIMTNIADIFDVNDILTSQQTEIGRIQSDIGCIKDLMNGVTCTARISNDSDETIQNSLNSTIPVSTKLISTELELLSELSLEATYDLAINNQESLIIQNNTIHELHELIISQNVIITEQQMYIDALMETMERIGLTITNLHSND